MYHYGCKELGMTHLYFADDLLLLCHGDHVFACILRRGLDEFSMTSGLYPSLEKSTAFFSDMPTEIKEQISLALPFKEGNMPIKHLGVPMMTKKLCNVDFLSSLNVYWASMFVLPNPICASIEKILKWTWPSDWIRRFRYVLDVHIPMLNEVDDKVVWFNKKLEEVNFSVKEASNVLKEDMPSDKIKIMAKLENISNSWAKVISGERSIRFFDGNDRTVEVLLNHIVNTIRLKMLSLNIKWSRDVDKALKDFFIHKSMEGFWPKFIFIGFLSFYVKSVLEQRIRCSNMESWAFDQFGYGSICVDEVQNAIVYLFHLSL
ncbi:hypothetical protein Tco_0262389, partial [Tanacetum coccineum]